MKLSRENKVRLYDFLCDYENHLIGLYGTFIKINDGAISKFEERNSVLIGTLCPTNIKKRNQYKYYILFDNSKPSACKTIPNDASCNLLRHIRNSIAHGNISATSKAVFELKDYDKNKKESMIGKIKADLLFQVIEIICNTHK